MSRNGITYPDVARYAEELTAGGTEPTIERIRIQLKTGSNSTIGAHLRTWRARRDPLLQLATKEKIPEELIILLKGLWERVIAQAEAQVETIKNDTQQEFAQKMQVIQQLQRDNARLQQSDIQLKHARDGLTQEKLALEKMIAESRTEIATVQAKHDGLIQQLADKQTRIEELHRQNKQIQANLEHYQAAQLLQRQQDQQHAEQRERELMQAVQGHKIENEQLKKQKSGLQQSHDQLQSAQSNVQALLEKVTLHDERISAELLEVNAALTKKMVSEDHWKTQHDSMHVKWEEQIKASVELQSQNAVLSHKLVTVEAQLADLADQNKLFAHDKWILGQEKAQLFGQLKQLQK